MKKYIACSFLIIAIFLQGCQSVVSPYTTFKAKVDETNISYLDVARESSISYGILDSDGMVETNGVYTLTAGESFERFLDIGNFIDQDMKYKILMFNNYKQTDFSVNGDSLQSYEVNIEKQKALQIPFEIDNLVTGLNDILIVIVVNSDTNLSKEERDTTLGMNMVYLRCNIYVNDENIASSPITEIPTVPDATQEIIIHKDIDKDNVVLPTVSLDINQPLNYFITVGNRNEKETEFVVILLEDWKQKEIFEGQDFLYVKIPAGEKLTVPITTSFTTSGIHEITALRIECVFQKMNEFSNDVCASMRLGVDVK